MSDGARLFWILFGAFGTGYAVHRVLRRKDHASTSERPTIMPLPQPTAPSSAPAPAPTPPVPVPSVRAFDALVERWRPEVTRRAAEFGLPVDPLLQWIAMESGGNMSSTGMSTEVGIWQLNLPGGNDDSKYGATLEGLRAIAKKSDELATQGHNALDLAWMTPAEIDMQVGAGVRKADAARATVHRVLAANGITWPETSYDFGAALKQIHALPAVIGDLIPTITKRSGPPASWDDFHREVMALPVDQMSKALRPYAVAPSKHGFRSRLEDTLRNAEIFGKAWARAFA